MVGTEGGNDCKENMKGSSGGKGDGESLWTRKDGSETGAKDVYVVENRGHGEVVITAKKECILEVDVEAGRMVVHLLDGLL